MRSLAEERDYRLLATIVLALSILIQFAAAILALRLIRPTGWLIAWAMIAGALVLMGARRAITFYRLVLGDMAISPDLTAELVALAISVLMLAGVARIGPLLAARQRSEEAVRRNEDNYRGMIENMTDTFYRTDADGLITMGSQSAEALLGRKVKDLIGTPLADLYANEGDRELFLATLKENGGSVRNYNTLLRHANGSLVWAATSAHYVYDNDGQVVGLEGTARDITEQRRADELITRLGRIVEDSANEIYVFDSETLRFMSVNRGARENLGYTMEELSGLTPIDIKPEITKEQFKKLTKPLRDGVRKSIEFETVHCRKDGTTYNVEVSLQLAWAETPPVFFAVIDDVTDRRHTEEQLRQAQKMEAVGQLTGGIAHDFNNLLAVISGNLELAEEDAEPDSDQADLIHRALGAAGRGSDLVSRLLAFSRGQTLRPKVINANEQVMGMTDLLSRTLGSPIEIVTKLAPKLWPVSVDPNQLESVILNLAVNARHAMPDGGILTLTTANRRLGAKSTLAELPAGQYVEISVADTGTGMTKETIERAFDPFYTTKPVGEGTGLGLSMVYGFVRQSGGDVAIRSKPGNGTSISIHLPRAMPSATVEAEMPGKENYPRGEGETILIVEDDPDLRVMTGAMLHGLGYKVIEAETGMLALKALRKSTKVRLMLTDVVLAGGMRGDELAVEVKRLRPEIGIVYTSGYADSALPEDVLSGDGTPLLRKPYRRAELAWVVRKTLADAEAGS